jgi:hypothetical protein
VPEGIIGPGTDTSPASAYTQPLAAPVDPGVAPTDGDVLIYDAAAGLYRPGASGGGGAGGAAGVRIYAPTVAGVAGGGSPTPLPLNNPALVATAIQGFTWNTDGTLTVVEAGRYHVVADFGFNPGTNTAAAEVDPRVDFGGVATLVPALLLPLGLSYQEYYVTGYVQVDAGTVLSVSVAHQGDGEIEADCLLSVQRVGPKLPLSIT